MFDVTEMEVTRASAPFVHGVAARFLSSLTFLFLSFFFYAGGKKIDGERIATPSRIIGDLSGRR